MFLLIELNDEIVDVWNGDIFDYKVIRLGTRTDNIGAFYEYEILIVNASGKVVASYQDSLEANIYWEVYESAKPR